MSLCQIYWVKDRITSCLDFVPPCICRCLAGLPRWVSARLKSCRVPTLFQPSTPLKNPLPPRPYLSASRNPNPFFPSPSMDAIRKQATKLREQVARQQQVCLPLLLFPLILSHSSGCCYFSAILDRDLALLEQPKANYLFDQIACFLVPIFASETS